MHISLSRIWAKTELYQSVLTHSVLSGIVAQVIVKKMLVPGVQRKLQSALLCSEAQFADWIGYLVSLHDIGKVEGQFPVSYTHLDVYKRQTDNCRYNGVLRKQMTNTSAFVWIMV